MEKIILGSVLFICIAACIICFLKCTQIIWLRRIERKERNEIEEIKNEHQKDMFKKKAEQAKEELQNKKELEDHLYELRIKEIDKIEEYRQKDREHEMNILKIEKGIIK